MLNTTKKKVIAIAATGLIFFGATNTFGAVSFTSLTQFVQNLFDRESGELTTQHTNEKNADVSAFETFLIDLKTDIETALNTKNETEKTRVTNEVNTYQSDLETRAQQQADADVNTKSQELEDLATQKIEESKAALDAKYNQLFQSSTPTTTPEQQ